MVCSASVPQRCPYGSDAQHYSTFEEAEKVWQSTLTEQYGALPSVKRFPLSERDHSLAHRLDDMTDDDFQNFVNASGKNYQEAEKVLTDRAAETAEWRSHLDAVNPFDRSDGRSSRCCDKETYESMFRDFTSYRDRTAFMVEALNESPHFHPSYIVRNFPNVGEAFLVHTDQPNSDTWVRRRADTVGGSDVGLLAMQDLMKADERPFFADDAYSTMEHMKSHGVTSEDVTRARRNALGHSGAMYRGTVWESRIRNDFARDHIKDFTVVNSKGQYENKDRDWQVVNLDGLIVRQNKMVPSEILEIKSAASEQGWENGSIPVSYRAQTLYYLNATGLERAHIRVLVNDSRTIDRTIEKNDEIRPGTGITMDRYITDRVQPWFEERTRNR